jgi:hypothetical protein
MTAKATESFVPLMAAPAAGQQTDFRVKVLPRGEKPAAFKTVENRAQASPIPSITTPHNAGNCEPRVSVQREGDKVTSIRVQCSCGQVIDLACVY